MFCGYGNNNLWVLIVIILLFGNGCGYGCGSNNCGGGCNNNCNSGCGGCNDCCC